MVVEESLLDYSNSYEDDCLENNHAIGGGEEESPCTTKQEKGKVPYNREDKGKAKYKEFTPRGKCFL